jgi:AraC-like DNA-binding protein
LIAIEDLLGAGPMATGAGQRAMLMIPLPFLFAAAALWAIWLHWRDPASGGGYAVLALAVLALQMGLIGARFGYGLGGLGPVQQAVAVIVPPVVWLAFLRPAVGPRLAFYTLPLLGLVALWGLWPAGTDSYIALISLGFAVALARLALLGEAALGWVAYGRMASVRGWLWAACLMLAATGLTDVFAGLAAMRGAAGLTGQAVAGAMVLTGVVAGGIIWRGRVMVAKPVLLPVDQRPVFMAVERLMAAGVFRDPDLTLQRIARKLGVPQREVSRAVNDCAGVNLSQYVNGFRVQAACVALRETDHPVTQVMFEAGFVTKSNFNKEFGRVTGVSPSVWRRTA